jgi:hypothetical protein
MSAKPAGTRSARASGQLSEIVSVDSVKHYWHKAAPAFDKAIDAGHPDLGRSPAELRAWELLLRRPLARGHGFGVCTLRWNHPGTGRPISAIDELSRSPTRTRLAPPRSADRSGLPGLGRRARPHRRRYLVEG